MNTWYNLTERIYHAQESPNRAASVTGLLLLALVTNTSVQCLVRGTEPYVIRVDIFALIAAWGFWLFITWSVVFVKQATLKTIKKLQFKENKNNEFLKKKYLYSQKGLIVGIFFTIMIQYLQLSANLETQAYLPLTEVSLWFFMLYIFIWVLLSVPVVDCFAMITNVITLPTKMKPFLVIRPLKPDKCGGVRAIGDLYFIFSAIAAIGGGLIIAATGVFFNEYIVYVGAFFLWG